MRLNFNNKGQTLVEYVLIIALIAMIAIVAVRTLGGALKDKITEMGCEVMGKEYIAGKNKGEGYCEGDEPLSLGD